jgi:hypothetical protein
MTVFLLSSLPMLIGLFALVTIAGELRRIRTLLETRSHQDA